MINGAGMAIWVVADSCSVWIWWGNCPRWIVNLRDNRNSRWAWKRRCERDIKFVGAQGRKAVGISVGRENVTEFVLVSLPCVQLPAYIDSSYQRGKRALRIRIQTRGYDVHKIHVSKVLRDLTQTRHSINGISVRSASHLILQQGVCHRWYVFKYSRAS